MKKLLLTLVLGMFAVAGFSQLTWDAHLGMTMNNYTKVESDMKVGYNFGVGLDYAFTDMWSFKSGINFTGRGAKYSEEYRGYKAEDKYCTHYLEIPLMAAAKFKISDNLKFVVNAGPYLAFGLGGKDKWEVTYSGDTESGDNKLFKKEDGANEAELKRFDLGLQYGVGLEIGKHYVVNITGQNGFISPFNEKQPDKDGKDVSPKNMTFTIGVGYRF